MAMGGALAAVQRDGRRRRHGGWRGLWARLVARAGLPRRQWPPLAHLVIVQGHQGAGLLV